MSLAVGFFSSSQSAIYPPINDEIGAKKRNMQG
jgi:hypothetical protein